MNERTLSKIQMSSAEFDGKLAELVGGQSVLEALKAQVHT
jgi:hypothetical protein